MEKYATMEAEGAGPEIFPTWQSIMIQILPWETTFFSREVFFPSPTPDPTLYTTETNPKKKVTSLQHQYF